MLNCTHCWIAYFSTVVYFTKLGLFWHPILMVRIWNHCYNECISTPISRLILIELYWTLLPLKTVQDNHSSPALYSCSQVTGEQEFIFSRNNKLLTIVWIHLFYRQELFTCTLLYYAMQQYLLLNATLSIGPLFLNSAHYTFKYFSNMKRSRCALLQCPFSYTAFALWAYLIINNLGCWVRTTLGENP